MKEAEDKIGIYELSPGNNWYRASIKEPRSLSSVILDGNLA